MKPRVPKHLDTQRLCLRQFNNDDLRDMHEYYSDIEGTRYTTGRPLTEGESWRAMAGMLGHWELHGYGPYAVALKESDTVLGVVGFWYPAGWPEPEIKWGLIRRYWGQGYASEAARAVHAAGLQHLPDLSLISLIHKDNHASIHLAKALGATFEKEIDFRDIKAHIYRHKATV